MRILLVEDDSFFQKFYIFKLQEEKYDVTVAVDGEDCMTKLTSFIPDLILLDLIMPKKDGFSVLQEVKNDHRLKHIPVLVFSTLGQEKDRERALSFGADDFVNKSLVDFASLVKKMQSLLSK